MHFLTNVDRFVWFYWLTTVHIHFHDYIYSLCTFRTLYRKYIYYPCTYTFIERNSNHILTIGDSVLGRRTIKIEEQEPVQYQGDQSQTMDQPGINLSNKYILDFFWAKQFFSFFMIVFFLVFFPGIFSWYKNNRHKKCSLKTKHFFFSFRFFSKDNFSAFLL